MLEFVIEYCGAPHDHIVHPVFDSCERHQCVHITICNGVRA